MCLSLPEICACNIKKRDRRLVDRLISSIHVCVEHNIHVYVPTSLRDKNELHVVDATPG